MSDIDMPKNAPKPKAARAQPAAAAPAPQAAAPSAGVWPSNRPAARRRMRSGTISDLFAIRTLSAPRQRRSAVDESGHYTTWFIPFPLLSAPRKRDSAVGKSGFMSRSFWPFPLLSPRQPKSLAGKSGTVFSDALGWGTLSRRS